MNWIDYTIIGIVVFSALVSLIRGFFREALSLITWMCAFIIAGYFYPYVAEHIVYFKDEFIRNACAIAALFIATLLVGAIVNYTIYRLVSYTGLSGTDRVLGVCFGIFRGILIVTAILFLIDSFSQFSQGRDWQHSTLIPYFHSIIQWFFDYIQKSSVFLN